MVRGGGAQGATGTTGVKNDVSIPSEESGSLPIRENGDRPLEEESSGTTATSRATEEQAAKDDSDSSEPSSGVRMKNRCSTNSLPNLKGMTHRMRRVRNYGNNYLVKPNQEASTRGSNNSRLNLQTCERIQTRLRRSSTNTDRLKKSSTGSRQGWTHLRETWTSWRIPRRVMSLVWSRNTRKRRFCRRELSQR